MIGPSQTKWGDRRRYRWFVRGMHLDYPMVAALILLSLLGLVVLYSAINQDFDRLSSQSLRLIFAFTVMIILAQIPPHQLEVWAPWLFFLGLALLAAVLLFGSEGKGAQRWLDLGFIRFQPSELIKIALPMMLAWFFSDKSLPPTGQHLLIAALIILVPALMIAKQPDLGTAILIACSGLFVIFLAGISWRLLAGLSILAAACGPLLWHFMHDYQQSRVLNFLNPENDPLGAGYHIIQSKIAIGSGGVYGKGWLNGTQSHLDFLPERSTDFIFAVIGEEFGFIGVLLLLGIYLFIIVRGIYIATQAQNTFNRLLAGSFILTFFVYIFVNIGMVSGILPVVGVPLPLVSFGGTSMVTLMATFGILMSIHTHRKLLSA